MFFSSSSLSCVYEEIVDLISVFIYNVRVRFVSHTRNKKKHFHNAMDGLITAVVQKKKSNMIDEIRASIVYLLLLLLLLQFFSVSIYCFSLLQFTVYHH